jgi:hypothetical protein
VDGSQSIPDLSRYLFPIFLIVAMLPIAAMMCWLASVPGARARRRGHSHARAIAVLGWISILVWPLWFIAMIWTISEPEWSQAQAQLHVPVTPTRARLRTG